MSVPRPVLTSSGTSAVRTNSGTTLSESLAREATSPSRYSQASKKNSRSARPRMASLGTPVQGREKSSVAAAHCPRVDRQAQVAPVKKAQSASPSGASSARRGKTTQRKATIEKTVSEAFGASTEANVGKKRPSAAFMAAKELKGKLGDTSLVLNQRLVSDGGKLPQKMVRAALSSGQLNLSEKGLEEVPIQVWSLNEPDEDHQHKAKGLSMDKIEEEDDSWWVQVDLSKLYLASNRLSSIPSDIEKLSALVILDLHDNALQSIPSEIGKLDHLRKLDLSHNKLRKLPEEMFALRSLVCLSVSNNELNRIGDGISSLDSLETINVSHNMLKSLPPSTGFLHKLNILNANNNKLSSLPDEISFLRNIKTLDFSRNELETMPNALSELGRLEIVYLRHNRLSAMPQLRNCLQLKELYIGNNLLTELTSVDIENIPNVKILELRDNKIALVPNEVLVLQSLERLDLANNELSTLPYSLGTLPNLKSLPIEGNPMKAIRRDIIQRGTIGLLKFLKSRLTNDEISAIREMGSSRGTESQDNDRDRGPSTSIPDKYAMQKMLTMDLSKRELEIIPGEVVGDAVEASVQRINLSNNRFRYLPDELNRPTLLSIIHEMDISKNILETLAPWISLAMSLQYLNVGNNRLSSLPSEFVMLKNLREVALPYNRFTEVPDCLHKCFKLENILMCGNQITSIDVDGLASLENLAVLDLQNNSIDQVPPELGNLKQIRSLSLEGNAFRVPRPAILVKGTQAVMAYLRDRIPHQSASRL